MRSINHSHMGNRHHCWGLALETVGRSQGRGNCFKLRKHIPCPQYRNLPCQYYLNRQSGIVSEAGLIAVQYIRKQCLNGVSGFKTPPLQSFPKFLFLAQIFTLRNQTHTVNYQLDILSGYFKAVLTRPEIPSSWPSFSHTILIDQPKNQESILDFSLSATCKILNQKFVDPCFKTCLKSPQFCPHCCYCS